MAVVYIEALQHGMLCFRGLSNDAQVDIEAFQCGCMSFEVLVFGQPNVKQFGSAVLWELFAAPVGWRNHAWYNDNPIGGKRGAG